MKAKEMHSKSTAELQKDLTELQTKLLTAHVEYKTKEVKNVKLISTLRRDIARTLTVLREQEISKGAKK